MVLGTIVRSLILRTFMKNVTSWINFSGCTRIEYNYLNFSLCNLSKSAFWRKIESVRMRFWAVSWCSFDVWHSFLSCSNYLHRVWYWGVILATVSISIQFILCSSNSYYGSILGNLNAGFLLRMETWCDGLKNAISLTWCQTYTFSYWWVQHWP